jgi:hypothetical protein
MSKIESLLLCAFAAIFLALLTDSLLPGTIFWLLQHTIPSTVPI